jgi:acetylornithine/LysW-gamma-L-lysine aminotransferase
MTDNDSISELEAAHTSGVYPKRPLAVVRGEGALLWDADGKEYIDCVGGQGAANLGHAHPVILEALTRQAARLVSCPEIFYNEVRAHYLQALTSAAPDGLDRAFLCNSGAEAVEAGIKFARLATGRTRFVAAAHGFHGRTLGALSATWNRDYRAPFEPLTPQFDHVPYNDLAALDSVVTSETAAVLLEPVQGEGGVHPAEPAYLQEALEICRKRGALLMLDEVQTGFGRTGSLFACQRYGVSPDVLMLAKSIAGGLPMGACLFNERVGKPKPMTHGSTFGGNPLTCAAGLATLRVLQDEHLPERADRLGQLLMAQIRELRSPWVRQVRGLGLLVGVELRMKVTPVLRAMQQLGVLALPAGSTVLRLLPPLVIKEEDLEKVVRVVGEALESVQPSNGNGG